jgi:hypothetical protein
MPVELSFDREARRREHLAFIRTYAAWVKRTPNAEWSRQQAELIDSFYENAKNMPISSKVYLERVAGRRKRIPYPGKTG